MSLRSRVALLILVVFLAGMVAALARTLQDGQSDLQRRLQFTQSLTVELLDLVHGLDPESPPPVLSNALMVRLEALQRDGFFELMLEEPRGVRAKVDVTTEIEKKLDAASSNAPRWFARLMGIDEDKFLHEIGQYQGKYVYVYTDTAAQVRDVWNQTKATMQAQFGILLLLCTVIYVMLGQWLSPIDRIITGLKEMEKGNFTSRIARLPLSELNQISDNVNHLADVLSASKMENERLQSEAISLQERERRRLAQELHDSLGQAISAIKAVSVAIDMRTRQQMPEIADSARSIEKISENAYASVRELMRALRPAVLDELGLKAAIEQMVEDWNSHHESAFCRLAIQCRLDDLHSEQTINVYRILQETLTNIIKHAKATEVDIRVAGEDIISMYIVDNGVGFDMAAGKKGMGLWNIQDRVNLLQGKLKVESSPGKGVFIQIEFPRVFKQRSQQS